MKPYVKILLCILFISFLVQGNTQTNKQAGKSKSVKVKKASGKEEAELPPPPPQEEMKEVSIEPAGSADTSRSLESLMPAFPSIDTTASPDDALTQTIVKLLQTTDAINLGITFADNMPKQDEGNEQLQKFYKRFMEDMKNGTARRWIERIYIREYRKRFNLEEVSQLISFYETPLGKKLLNQTREMLPGIMEQGKMVGSYLGVKMYIEMLKETNN